MPALRKGDEDRTLPVIEVGSDLDLQKLIPSQHFTKPPARYSEASLVKELENGVLAVHRLMPLLFRPFKIVAMCG